MSVKVAIRVRPFNQRQTFLGCTACVQMRNNTTVVHQVRGKDKKQHYFTFDYSFWSHNQFQQQPNGLLVPIDDTYVDQKKVYSLLGQQILQNAWVGFNCCLFAYGQTGAGKSYSMIGYGVNKGIIPMACEELFQRIKRFEKKNQRQYEVTISMLEIYNQKVQDLFTSTNKRPTNGLKIRQNKALGVYVEGLSKYPVSSYAEIQKKMQEGSKNRSLASTLMNQYSSRAHTIVMLEFIQKEWITNKKMTKKTSLINLVDLAGSQRVSKTGVGDNKDRLKQASLINKSLHTLGRVIQALADQCIGKGKNIAIPYRESALTRILQNALGGNSKTTMICAISPANDNCQQTLSTLRYADKTKKIKNKPVVNESEVDKLIRQLRQENERLKKMLQTADDEKMSPTKGLFLGSTESQIKQTKSNVRASIREIQREIRKNLQSFAINTEDVIDEADYEESLMMTEFIDLQDPSISSEFQTSFSSTTGKSQVYITNLNEDELLNFKIKYSCQKNLLITNNSKKNENLLDEQSIRKVVLCGLGIEENHARIVKDNESGKYFIEALSESSSQYTLLNGKPVYTKQQLKHNDRIILGTNSVFLFKNLVNPEERSNKKYTSQKAVGYEFAINERQQELQNQSPLFYPGHKRRPSSNQQSSSLQDKQLFAKLEEIQNEFSRMLEENQRQTREKQNQYKQKLLDLQREKQAKEKQKMSLQSKLKEKKQETYRLKSKQLQIQKLQKKLAQFEQEKKKRKIARQSMLLDGLDDGAYNDVFDPKDFQDLDNVNNKNEFSTQTQGNFNNRKSFARKMNRQSKAVLPQKEYYEVVLQEYDIKDQESALGTTNTNSIQIQESYFANQTDFNQQDAHNKMKKPTKKALNQTPNQQVFNQAQEIEKYNKIVQSYLNKIKHRMGVFTKLYDITIYSQKLTLQQQQIEEFNCQKNGGIHFCRHCKKAINTKVQHIEYHENRYEYNEVHKGSSQKSTRKNNRKSPKENLKIKSGYENNNDSQQHQEPEQTNNIIINKKGQKLKLNPSNLSDLVREQIQNLKSQKSQTSKKGSQSIGRSDDSLLLNGTQIQIEEKSAKKQIRKKSADHSPFSHIGQPSVQQGKKLQESKNKKSFGSSLNKSKQQILKSSFALDFDDQVFENDNQNVYQNKSKIENHNQHEQKNDSNQNEEEQNQESLLKSYIAPDFTDFIEQKYSSKPKLSIYPQTASQITFYQVKQNVQEKKIQPQVQKQKPQCVEIQIQTDTQNDQKQDDKQSFQIKSKKVQAKSKFLPVDFDFSVSDIQEGDHQNSVQQSLNLSSLNNFKQQELTNQIQLLKQKIKQLQGQNLTDKQKVIPNTQISSIKQKNQKNEDMVLEENEQNLSRIEKSRSKMKRYTQKNKIQEQSSQEQEDSPKNRSKSKRLTELPSTYTDKDFLKSRIKNSQGELQKQLESNLLICNNENIINERNLSIRKRKRQVQELRKTLIKKQKIELQKQLFVLIPMIERFNLMAKEMNRLIEAKVEIQYKNFCHYEIIQALKNFTKSKWKKDSSFSNVQIKVVVANLEQARIYKWPVEVFKNRFEIAEEVFQKYIQSDGNQSMVNYNIKDQDRSKDPFWDPIDFVPSGFGYLSIECLLYNIGYDGEISFVFNSRLIARAYVSIIPVKVKRRAAQNAQEELIAIEEKSEQEMQIFNPRNYLQESLYFTFTIEGLTFMTPQRQNSSPPLKFTVSYELLMDDYKTQTYSTPEIDFKSYQEEHQINYLRRHCFKQVSQSTLAYISDCPLKITLNLMKDYNEECLNTSFNQDLQRSVEQTNSLHDTSLSSIDISKQLQKIQTKSYKTPDKSLNQNFQVKKLDFSKKQKKPIIYENTQLLDKIQKECQDEEKKRKQKRKQLYEKQAELRGKKDNLKKDDKDCTIY